ncbi:MAG: hypothetical protein JWQ98_574 [Chlorobi bacterium]|nr:hypothetical protein [Chlorobiota bacterium]
MWCRGRIIRYSSSIQECPFLRRWRFALCPSIAFLDSWDYWRYGREIVYRVGKSKFAISYRIKKLIYS